MTAPERYGLRKLPKMLAEWNALCDAVNRGDVTASQDALDKCQEWIDFAFGKAPAMDALIAEAVAKERERCAHVAEREGVYPELNIYAGGPEWYRHGKRIAAAIRAGRGE